jgi:uncharacterized membrane protein
MHRLAANLDFAAPVLTIGLLMIVLSIPLIMRWVPMNHLYGFRVPQTFSSVRVWYLANAYSGKGMLYTGVATMVCFGMWYFTPSREHALRILTNIVLYGGLAMSLVLTLLYLKRI